MKNFIMGFMICLIVYADNDPSAVARITALKGELKIYRINTRKEETARLLSKLYSGDSIKIGAGSDATIFFNTGKISAFAGDTAIKIKSAEIDTLTESGNKGAALFAFIAEREKTRDNAIANESKQDSQTIDLYEPGETTLSYGCPDITWGTYPGAQFYVVLMGTKNEEIWQIITVDTFLPYPEVEEDLIAGSYYMKIFAVRNTDTLSSVGASIDILGDEQILALEKYIKEIKNLCPDPFTFHLLIAHFYEQNSLRLDAIDEYGNLLEMKPDEPFVHKALCVLYDEIGFSELAGKYRQRLRELTSE